MSSPLNSGHWPSYPRIPIYLETSDNNGTTRSYGSISPISPTPAFRGQGRAIHVLAAASTQFTNISSASPATHFSILSPIWPIPEPPPEITQHPPKRPTLRFFPTSRPRIQLDGVPLASTERLPQSGTNFRRKSWLGSSIQDTPTTLHRDPVVSPKIEKPDRSSNIAQRIEAGLWQYSLSGNVIKRWLLEIISWCISAVCMATIVGVLLFYKDKKIPNWPGSLTLNALIAVLSKVAGAALILPVSEALGQLKWSWFQGHSKTMWDFEIFDNASRGPWGSFLLLIRTKGKALAALGAIITLFSLALDPFFQQLVDFPDRWALQGNSSIPRIIYYEPRFIPETREGAVLSSSNQDIAAVAKKFFYENGTQPVPFGNGTRPEIPISCPTSNCTWPIYDTLGVCSKCADVSNLLEFKCLNATADWIANLTGLSTNDTAPHGRMCGYFLNATSELDPPVLMSGYLTEPVESGTGSGIKGEALLTRLLPLATNPEKESVYGGSIHFKQVRDPLIDVLIVSSANGTESVFRHEAPVAHECVLSWCVKTIKSKYYLANYEEEVIETWENNTAGPYPWISVPFTTPTFEGTDVYYLENITLNKPLAMNKSDITHYGLSNGTFIRVAAPFEDIFPSFYTATTNSSDLPVLRYKTNNEGAPFNRVLDFNPWSGSNNVTQHMERLAIALTNVIRSTPNATVVRGDATCTETYVSVRWAWLILPISLLFLSLLFLVATMKKTSKEGVWKTSAIATLLYGLPDAMQKKITTAANDGTPRAAAKQLKVKLHADRGWRVSENHLSPPTPKPRQYQPPPGWI